MKSKYVILEEPNETPVVFVIDACLNHSDIARAFQNWKVVSGGFCSIDSHDPENFDKPLVTVWGESVSLGVKSREIDSKIIAQRISLF